MRLAFMGTPEFATPALAELLSSHEIACVYTRAPKPSGRGQKVRPSPVEELARAHGIAARTPRNFKAVEEVEAFRALDLDAAIVVAYGLILPRAILDAPRLGCFNLHASLLPRWRGAAPIHRAIMAGDKKTGVQVMRMEEGLDTGPVLLSETVEIHPTDTAGALHDRLAPIGASLLSRALAAIERGAIVERPQSTEGVTYAEKVTPAEARIDWRRPADAVDCHIRGLSPFPGAYFDVPSEKGPQRIKALMSRTADRSGAPGDVVEAGERLIVACGKGAVEIVTLQRPGKSAQGAVEFLRGYPLAKSLPL
jgi:methionyl-tRNA formyltransferase